MNALHGMTFPLLSPGTGSFPNRNQKVITSHKMQSGTHEGENKTTNVGGFYAPTALNTKASVALTSTYR